MLPGDEKPAGPNFEIHRLKGRLFVDDGSEKMVQGVREIFDIFDSPAPSADADTSQGKLVLIGRHLSNFDFPKSLHAIINSSS